MTSPGWKASASYCRFLAEVRPDDAIEIRLDENDYMEEEIRDIFSCPRKSQLIATCHVELPSQVEHAAQQLTTAVLAGACVAPILLATLCQLNDKGVVQLWKSG